MADHDDYLRTGDRNFRLFADVGLLMGKGAGYAALFCFALIIVGWAMLGISRALPEESKQAPDPTPLSFLMIRDGAAPAIA